MASLLGVVTMTTNAQNNCEPNWLSTKGNKLVDINDNEVILAGVNWFGFETEKFFPHGIWSRDHKSVLKQIKDLGFNCIRVPWHNGMLKESVTIEVPSYGSDPYTGVSPMNEIEATFTKPIQLLDEMVKWCQENDIKVILDCHSRNNDAYLTEKLWFVDQEDTLGGTLEVFTEQQWIDDWVFMAERYKNYSAVIGMDINNEPNGKIDNPRGARWGTGDKFDWRLASERCGNAILKANPNVLILVEGIEAYTKLNGENTSYWWGGNLQGAKDYPVRLSNPNKLMYSPHEYGPTVFDQKWFNVPEFPSNMPGIWETQFNFLTTNNTSPLLIGELGIKGQGGKDEIWFQEFINFIKENKLHYTFWALNPNSGDTGGILANDWTSVVQWKMDYLKPILHDRIPNCVVKKGGTLSNEDFIKNETVLVKILPNPTTDKVSITSDYKIKSVTIYNLSGKIVLENNVPESDDTEFSLANFSNGMYIVKTETENSLYTTKIIKE